MESRPNTSWNSRLKSLSCAALVVLWPLIYFYRFLIPNRSFSLTLGNDFVWLYYKYKVYLLAVLAEGRFPLWSPSEAAGFPFYSSPFAQIFYPLNLILLLFYKVAGGYSIFDHQAFTVAAISLYSLGLYLWLSRLVANRRAVMFAVLLMATSFKLAELFRFTNAAHAAAWMPWLLYGVTLAVEDGRRRLAGVVLFVSSLMLLTAGYPYYAYYCIFLILPYAALIWFGTTRKVLFEATPIENLNRTRYAATLVLPSLGAAMVCAPYFYKMMALMSQVTDRGGGDYDYSTSYPFLFGDSIGSLVFPPAAQTEGWYYFSIIGLLIVIVFLASCCLREGVSGNQRRLALILAIWIGLISYLSYGRDSYLFDLLWSYFPGFSRLRAWGRLNIVLVPLLALLAARSYSHLESWLTSNAPVRRQILFRWISVTIIAGAVIGATQWWLLSNHKVHFYWTEYFSPFHGEESRFLYFTAVSTAALSAVLLRAAWKPLRASGACLSLLTAAILAVGVADMRPVGSQQWAYPASAEQARRESPDISQVTAEAFFTPRSNLRETISLNSRFNAGYLWNWHFHRYTSFHDRIFEGDNFDQIVDPEEFPWMCRLLGLDDGARIFVSQSIDHRTARDFFLDSDDTVAKASPMATVMRYDDNRLILSVEVNREVFLSFIDNWDPDWRAWVNGQAVHMEKLFGTFKSVRVPAGVSSVEFAYCPFGMGDRPAAEPPVR